MLTDSQAEQVSKLLNTRNELTIPYTRERVMASALEYHLKLSETGAVVACVQVKKLQWYQFEVLHLTVAESVEGQGYGKALLCDSERIARAGNGRILQCTIRDDNTRSRGLFEGFGFRRVNMFFNVKSGNNVGVYQKVLEAAR